MQGKIIKGIGGFYYIDTEQGIFECKAKGIFRKKRIKPLVGDDVEITILDNDKMLGNIDEILPRKNELIRPAVANVDQAVVVFALTNPEPNLNLLDRFLVMMEMQNVPTVICFNKVDIANEEHYQELKEIYKNCSSKFLLISSLEETGMEELYKCLENKTTVLAGPSGVGKSTVLNWLHPEAEAETGTVSQKTSRGRHTTRHSELFAIGKHSYLMDTPGFSSLEVPNMQKEELKDYFSEFFPYEGTCRFHGCVHIHEPGCQVKEEVENGNISKSRYENYLQMFDDLKDRKQY